MTIHYDFLLATLYSVTRTAGRKTNQYMYRPHLDSSYYTNTSILKNRCQKNCGAKKNFFHLGLRGAGTCCLNVTQSGSNDKHVRQDSIQPCNKTPAYRPTFWPSKTDDDETTIITTGTTYFIRVRTSLCTSIIIHFLRLCEWERLTFGESDEQKIRTLYCKFSPVNTFSRLLSFLFYIKMRIRRKKGKKSRREWTGRQVCTTRRYIRIAYLSI